MGLGLAVTVVSTQAVINTVFDLLTARAVLIMVVDQPHSSATVELRQSSIKLWMRGQRRSQWEQVFQHIC